jgi:AbrB family looped-hinge helix DNA binding protein
MTLREVRLSSENAPASWTAVALHRFSPLRQPLLAILFRVIVSATLSEQAPYLDQPGATGHAGSVTTTISSKGQVVIPRPIRERRKFRAGDDFLLFELSNGDIMLRRVRPPKKSLA